MAVVDKGNRNTLPGVFSASATLLLGSRCTPWNAFTDRADGWVEKYESSPPGTVHEYACVQSGSRYARSCPASPNRTYMREVELS